MIGNTYLLIKKETIEGCRELSMNVKGSILLSSLVVGVHRH